MSEQDEQGGARPIDPDLTHRRLPSDDPRTPSSQAEQRFEAPDEPTRRPPAQPSEALPDSAEPAAHQPPSPVQRLMPPTQAIQRSRVAEEYVTHTAGQPSSATPPASDDGRWLPPDAPRRSAPADLGAHDPRPDPVAATFAEAAAARPPQVPAAPQSEPSPQFLASPQGHDSPQFPVGAPTPSEPVGGQSPIPPAAAPPVTDPPLPELAQQSATPAPTNELPPEAFSPESIGGLGDQPDAPIVTLPPVADAIAGYPLSERTGEPVRNPIVLISMLCFALAAAVSTATYWWYWWEAINITNFHDSAALIRWLEPRPGSGSSIVLVCVMAVIGAIMTAGPGVAGYNTWHGASFARTAGLVACGTSLLAIFVLPWSWLALGFSAIGVGLLWLPKARAFLTAMDAFANPPRPEITPYENVAYGPAPRFR